MKYFHLFLTLIFFQVICLNPTLSFAAAENEEGEDLLLGFFIKKISQFESDLFQGDQALIRRNPLASEFYQNAIDQLNSLKDLLLENIEHNIGLRWYLAENNLYDKNEINAIRSETIRNTLVSKFDEAINSINEKLDELKKIEKIKKIIAEERYTQLFAQYPKIFDPLPEEWKYALANCVFEKESMNERLKKINHKRNWIKYKKWKHSSCNIWQIIVNTENIRLDDLDKDFIYLIVTKQNNRSYYKIIDWVNYGNTEHTLDKKISKEKILNYITNNYKIHLMPTDNEFYETIYRLIKAIKYDKKLSRSIYNFKFYNNFDSQEELSARDQSRRNARIVIYCATGKKYVQNAFDKLKILFSDMPGLNIAPRYSAGEGMLYVAQGDGDYKKDEALEPYYDALKVYYNPTITGTFEDYHIR